MNKYKLIFPALIASSLMTSNVSYADESISDPHLIEEGTFIEGTKDDSGLVEGVDYDIETINIYMDDLEEDIYTTPGNFGPLQLNTNNNSVGTMAVVMPGPEIKTQNFKAHGTSIGTKTLWTTSGQPGMDIGLSYSEQVTATVSNNYGASNSALSREVGFTIGKSYTVTSSGSYKIPKTHNGKTVIRAEVTGHPLYNKYSMRLFVKNNIYFRYDDKGTVYSYKPIGIHVKYKHYYKKWQEKITIYELK